MHSIDSAIDEGGMDDCMFSSNQWSADGKPPQSCYRILRIDRRYPSSRMAMTQQDHIQVAPATASTLDLRGLSRSF